MASYLIGLREQINGFFNCQWFDCKTKCFISEGTSPKVSNQYCVSGLDQTTEGKNCDQLVTGFYSAVVTHLIMDEDCPAKDATLQPYFEKVFAAQKA